MSDRRSRSVGGRLATFPRTRTERDWLPTSMEVGEHCAEPWGTRRGGLRPKSTALGPQLGVSLALCRHPTPKRFDTGEKVPADARRCEGRRDTDPPGSGE